MTKSGDFCQSSNMTFVNHPYDFCQCFIVDLVMQHESSYVDLINRLKLWNTKTEPNHIHTPTHIHLYVDHLPASLRSKVRWPLRWRKYSTYSKPISELPTPHSQVTFLRVNYIKWRRFQNAWSRVLLCLHGVGVGPAWSYAHYTWVLESENSSRKRKN